MLVTFSMGKDSILGGENTVSSESFLARHYFRRRKHVSLALKRGGYLPWLPGGHISLAFSKQGLSSKSNRRGGLSSLAL